MKKTIYLTCALILLALTARTAGSSNDSVKALLFTLTDSTTIAVDITTTDSIGFNDDATHFVFYKDGEETLLLVDSVEYMEYTTDMPEKLRQCQGPWRSLCLLFRDGMCAQRALYQADGRQ